MWLLYPVCGAVAGVMAGLLGVGGGIVIVPILLFLFHAQGFPQDHSMQMALGTSLGTIAFTSISSFRAHHQRGAVEWSVVKRIAPGIVAGTFGGTWIAAMLSFRVLRLFFAGFLVYVATQMLLDARPKPARTLPGAAGLSAVGAAIGVVSGLVGIGGGSLSVPFLTWCNVSVRSAIGTSAAIGFPIAVAGALGYAVNGLGAADRPPWSLGYVNGPALAGIAAFSVPMAPLGARLAHALPVGAVKRVFAVFLLLVAGRLIWGLL